MGKKRKSKAQHVDEAEEEVPVGWITMSMGGEVKGDKKRRHEVSCDKKLRKVMIHHGLFGFYVCMIFPT
jgi:ribosomal protein L39E